MKKFTIHTLGQPLEEVFYRTEAVWTLGSRYGNAVLVESKKNGAIVWSNDSVKINPELIAECEKAITQRKIKAGYRS